MLRTTDSGHGPRVAPNRLLGQLRPTRPDQVWVGDITCLPTQGGGWLYLASWQDACSRKVVGRDLRTTMLEDLVSEALRRALAVRQPAAGLLMHSDKVPPRRHLEICAWRLTPCACAVTAGYRDGRGLRPVQPNLRVLSPHRVYLAPSPAKLNALSD